MEVRPEHCAVLKYAHRTSFKEVNSRSHLHVSIPASVKDEIDTIARECFLSKSEIVAILLIWGLEKLEQKVRDYEFAK